MARGRKRVVEATPDTIKKSIADIETSIATKTEEIKSLKLQKKELLKDLAIAEKKAAIKKEEADMRSLVALMREKNISINDVEKIISSKCDVDVKDNK